MKSTKYGMNNYKHGMSKTKIHGIWRRMKDRCFNPKAPKYHLYGGRGITICDRWLTFVHFFKDMGHRPDGRTLDRVDNDGNYEPCNCRWSTPTEQANNRRRRNSCKRITT